MPNLSLSLLGPFTTLLNNQPFYNFRTQKVQALLVFLAVERNHPHYREALMELLWPDMPLESAQVNLRQTIYRLRQAIPEVDGKKNGAPVPLLLSDRQTVQLNPEIDLQLDLEKFQEHIDQRPALVIELYRGDFLADFYLVDSHEFETWAEQWREKLRQQALFALDRLTQSHLQNQEFAQAQSFAWRQLEIDYLRESAYQQLMRAFVGNGQRSAALSQFQIMQQRFKEELGIEPSPESVSLYREIQAEAQNQIHTKRSSSKHADVQQMPVFMLTDIENSTRLWDTHRQAMLKALLHHNTILEGQINTHGGRILELRGDGVKAVFESTNPLPCVLAIQKAFQETHWGEIGRLKIRIGLHGVPAIRQGSEYFLEDDKYYGPVLNHTARIMDAGWGGQILVSEQIHHAFPLPAGASWQDYGLQTLKSLNQPVHIYGVNHPDLSHQSFPELRNTPAEEKFSGLEEITIPNNLEAQPTPFVGRQKELANLNELLQKPAVRLISIVGPGGIGKTRFAIAVAESQIKMDGRQKEPLFPDGVYIVHLSPVSDPDLIGFAIAKAINLPLEPRQDNESLERTAKPQSSDAIAEKLLGYLQNKRLLIIMDNFEHLLMGADLLPKILHHAPEVQIMATSRERLHLREEQIFPLQGLEYPDWEAPEDPCDYTAMELFLQSAHRIRPDFDLQPTEMVYLTRICQLVGGMPLGLELAASWVDLLSVEDIAAEIKGSLDFLETEIRNIPDRHRSIRAVFDSSWGRLSEAERTIFPRLSIFRGSFSREAAQQVSSASIRNLASLVGKSLLQYIATTDHYQIHELLRQYGAEKLKQDPENERTTRDLHSTFYCDRIQFRFQYMFDGKIQMAFHDYERELANFKKAWDWAVLQSNVKNINKAIDGLSMYFSWNWSSDEGLETCQSAIEMFQKAGISTRSLPEISPDNAFNFQVFAKVLGWQGYFNLHFDSKAAVENFAQSSDIIKKLQNAGWDVRKEKMLVLFLKGLLEFNSGELKIAKACFQESLSLSQETNQQWMILRNLTILSDLARNIGNPREAQEWSQQCLTAARSQNNPWGEVSALNKLGWAARSMMAYEEATNLFEQSLELSRQYQDEGEMMSALASLGYLAIFQGKLEEAERRFNQGISLASEVNIPQRAINWLMHVGITEWLKGNLKLAGQSILEALSLSKRVSAVEQIFPTTCYAEYLTLIGDYQQAITQTQIVNDLSKNVILDRFLAGRLTRVKGWLALVQKNFTEAKIQFEKSVDFYQTIADDEQIAWSQAGLARALIGLGKLPEAHHQLQEALWTAIEIQGYIPLVFTLPVAILFLGKVQPEQARKAFSQIQVAPFPAKVPFFEDTVYKYLPPEIAKLPYSVEMNLSEVEIRKQLWAAASSILSSWIQIWIDEPELNKKIISPIT